MITKRRQLDTQSKIKSATLDVDPLPVYVYGSQEGAAYNGHYHNKVYTPVAAYFSAQGDLDSNQVCQGFTGAALREGDCGKSEKLLPFIIEEHARAKELAEFVEVRIDAAGGCAEILDGMSDAEIAFTTRVPNNLAGLGKLIEPHLKRNVGRPPKEGYEYAIELGKFQAKPWQHAQRLVLVVVDKPDASGQLSLFPRFFVLATSRSERERDAWGVLEFYRGRGTFEDRYGELNACIRPRLSSSKFAENEAIFLLSLCAFNLLELLRRKQELLSGGGWDLRRLQRTLINTGARVAKRSRQIYVYIMRSFSALFAGLSSRVSRLAETFSSPPSRRVPLPAPIFSHQSYHPRH